jgi:hypothetical protein
MPPPREDLNYMDMQESWYSVASDKTGQIVYASCAKGKNPHRVATLGNAASSMGGAIWKSSDGGQTWSMIYDTKALDSRGYTDDIYNMVASGDGRVILAITRELPGPVISTDFGATWTGTQTNKVEGVPNTNTGCSMDYSGTKILCKSSNDIVMTSDGVNWKYKACGVASNGNKNANCVDSGAPTLPTPSGIKISGDGSTAYVWQGNKPLTISKSTDDGSTWAVVYTEASTSAPYGFAVSEDGQTAAFSGGYKYGPTNPSAGNGNGRGVTITTDGGATWQVLQTLDATFYGLSLSADGKKLVGITGNAAYVTSDYGHPMLLSQAWEYVPGTSTANMPTNSSEVVGRYPLYNGYAVSGSADLSTYTVAFHTDNIGASIRPYTFSSAPEFAAADTPTEISLLCALHLKVVSKAAGAFPKTSPGVSSINKDDYSAALAAYTAVVKDHDGVCGDDAVATLAAPTATQMLCGMYEDHLSSVEKDFPISTVTSEAIDTTAYATAEADYTAALKPYTAVCVDGTGEDSDLTSMLCGLLDAEISDLLDAFPYTGPTELTVDEAEYDKALSNFNTALSAKASISCPAASASSAAARRRIAKVEAMGSDDEDEDEVSATSVALAKANATVSKMAACTGGMWCTLMCPLGEEYVESTTLKFPKATPTSPEVDAGKFQTAMAKYNAASAAEAASCDYVASEEFPFVSLDKSEMRSAMTCEMFANYLKGLQSELFPQSTPYSKTGPSTSGSGFNSASSTYKAMKDKYRRACLQSYDPDVPLDLATSTTPTAGSEMMCTLFASKTGKLKAAFPGTSPESSDIDMAAYTAADADYRRFTFDYEKIC